MKKRGLILLVSLFVCLPGVVSGAGETGIGYVDLERAFYGSNARKEADTILSQKAEKAQEGIKTKKEELERLEDSIRSQLLILSEEARKEKEWEYQKAQRDYERLAKDSDDELKRELMVVRQKILKDLARVTEKVGKEGDYMLIFEKSNNFILYAGDTVDLTDEVIKKYNETKSKTSTLGK